VEAQSFVAIQTIEHWFDRATKFLASGAVPRRSLLESAVLAGASTLAAKTTAFAASNGEVAQRIPPILPVPRTVAPCTLQYTAAGTTTTTFSAQSAYQGKPLVLHGVQTTTGHHDRSVSLHIEVTHGGALLFELVHSALQGRGPDHRRVLASRGAVTYGAAVRGVRRVQYLASGGTVTGFMDGRGFVTNVRTPAALRFADRRPAPAAGVDPGLAAAVRALFANASSEIRTCRTVRGDAPTGPARRAEFPAPNDGTSRRTLLAQSVSALAAPVLVAQGAGVSGPCQDCINNCDKRFGGCGSASAGACLATLGIGCVVGVVACGSDWIDCNNNCNQTGGPCCKQQCPPTNNICCAAEDTCCYDTCCDPSTPLCINAENLTGGTGYCCPSGQIGCPGVAPPAGQGGMSVLVNTCCPSGSTCCNGSCCAPDQHCADSLWGICCPTGQQWCATGFTVSTTNVLTGVTSVVNAMACCNGTCLKDPAGNLVCCQSGQVCGSTCCLSGWHCMRTNSGASVCCDHGLCGGELCCGVNDVCAKVVDPKNGITSYRCQPPGVKCGNTYCGVANPVCCNGVCCASNQTCVNGRCTGPACPPGQVPCQYTPNQCCPPKFVCCAGGPTGHSCCNPATQVCCGGRGCLPLGTQCIQ